MRFGDKVATEVCGFLKRLEHFGTDERDCVVRLDGTVLIPPVTLRRVLVPRRHDFEYSREDILRYLHARDILKRIRNTATAESAPGHEPPLEDVNVTVGDDETLTELPPKLHERLFRGRNVALRDLLSARAKWCYETGVLFF